MRSLHHEDLVPNEYGIFLKLAHFYSNSLIDLSAKCMVADFLDTSRRLKHKLQREYIRNISIYVYSK